jgi:hypothetical protein
VLRVRGEASARDVPRIGLNLGSQTSWGAEQLMANVLLNPGFEATEDGAIVVVSEVDGSEFLDDTGWLARPDHFWRHATFSVRTGRLAGTSGEILDSGKRDGKPEFRAGRELSGLQRGDIVALHRSGGDGLPANWWWENGSRNRIRTDALHALGSAGRQSLLLAPDDEQRVAAISFFDGIGDRAGKLLPMHGSWEVRFWARSEGGMRLAVQCRRLKSAPFLRQEVKPGAEWHEFVFRFQPHDDGPVAGLEFRLEAEGAGSKVWIDDVSLSPVDAPASGFRPEVVETLRMLRPGYLRDWQGQLGDSFANRIAPAGSRHPSRYRPGDETSYGYSLPQFLELCHEVGAQPWVVLPTTWQDADWTAAGEYLRAALRQYGFREIVVEFGNENWNGIFRPAGIMDARRMAEAAQRGFRLLKGASGEDSRILPALGAQFVNPGVTIDAARIAPEAGIVAAAPYYAYSPKAEEGVAALFPDGRSELDAFAHGVARGGKQAAIYEMNAHSLSAGMPAEEVSQLVSSAASGTAILYRSLLAMESGIERQGLYSLAGFDTTRQDGKLVRLFGLARDLAAAGHLRPTGLALELANQAAGGELHEVDVAGSASAQRPRVAVVAFHNGNRWSLIAASASPVATEMTVEFPGGMGALPATLWTLESASPLAGNEEAQEVALQHSALRSKGNRVSFRLAPYGAAALVDAPAPGSVPNRNKSR